MMARNRLKAQQAALAALVDEIIAAKRVAARADTAEAAPPH